MGPGAGRRRYSPAQLGDAACVRGLCGIGARVFNLYLNSPEEVSESELVTGVCVPLVWSGSRWPDPVDGAGGRTSGAAPGRRSPR